MELGGHGSHCQDKLISSVAIGERLPLKAHTWRINEFEGRILLILILVFSYMMNFILKNLLVTEFYPKLLSMMKEVTKTISIQYSISMWL
jgi:hypothetical protein